MGGSENSPLLFLHFSLITLNKNKMTAKIETRITLEWWHDEDLGQPIKSNHLEELETDGMKRVTEMMTEGYTCGELHNNLCLSNDDPNEGISYSGWWKINTIRG